jgi:hypothetical protein
VSDSWLVVAVQKLWCRIEAVGPHHGSCFIVDPNLPEVLGIAQWLSKRPVK